MEPVRLGGEGGPAEGVALLVDVALPVDVGLPEGEGGPAEGVALLVDVALPVDVAVVDAVEEADVLAGASGD